MATLKETLELVITANVAGGVKGLQQVGTTAEQELGRTTQSTQKLGGQLQAIGAGMVGFGAVALVGLGKLATASEDAKAATLRLSNSLQGNPKLAGENIKAFTDLAASLQKKTAADDDSIVSGMAMLGTFRVTGEQIRGLTPLVVDYARKFGVDLVSANAAVGKALDGSIGALKRNGVSIDENLFKTDRYAAVTQALRQQVGGFAEAEGKTFSGQLQILKNQLGEVSEGVGVGAVEAFSKMFGAVEKVAGAFDKLSPGMQSTVGQFATFGAVGLIALGGFNILVGTLLKASANFTTLTGAVARHTGVTHANTAAVLEDAAAMNTAAGSASRFSGAMTGLKFAIPIVGAFAAVNWDDWFGGDAPEQAKGIAAIAASVHDLTDTELADWLLSANTQLAEYSGGLNQAERAQEIFNTVLKQSPGDAQRVADAFASLGFVIPDARQKINDFIETQQQGAINSQQFADGIVGLTQETQDYIDALTELDKTLHGTFDPLFAASDALDKNREAQQKVTTATYEQAAAQDAYNEALRNTGPQSATTVKAYSELLKANEELDKAQGDVAKSALDVQSKQDALRTAVANGSVSLDTARFTMQQWVNQGLLNQASADAQIMKLTALANTARDLQNQNVTMRILADTGPAYASLQAFLNTVRNAQGMVQLGGSGLAREAKAVGGPVMAGRQYLVGEKGPELFTPDVSGTITPNNQLARPGSTRLERTAANSTGATYAPTYNVVVNGTNLSGDEIVAAIKKHERVNGTAWRN